MYIQRDYEGMCSSKQSKLDVYKYIKKEDGFVYVSKPSYLSKGKKAEIFSKEIAKKAMYMFYFKGYTGKDIAKELGEDNAMKIGWANGRTLTYLGFGIRESDKEAGVKGDNQRGVLKDKVSSEEAQRMLDEVIEYVYGN